jgi:hypothetical protein
VTIPLVTAPAIDGTTGDGTYQWGIYQWGIYQWGIYQWGIYQWGIYQWGTYQWVPIRDGSHSTADGTYQRRSRSRQQPPRDGCGQCRPARSGTVAPASHRTRLILSVRQKRRQIRSTVPRSVPYSIWTGRRHLAYHTINARTSALIAECGPLFAQHPSDGRPDSVR